MLPYINGFVMAIKELIKTFALFLGYELPDSSGDTGTILDQMGDSMGDFGAGIDNANSGLDETKKKAKEVAKAVGNLPFDELHTISKPSNPDSGSDSGSGGAGGAMVDPRILDALNKWDYMFGDIRMKAMDIRDTILEWADKIGKVVDENIFKPIQNSWNKYGAGISANVKETFKNISHIVGGVFDVIGEKWKPFFQQASDLFFSLEETASEVLKGISRFFVYVWDNGGKTLFEGIADLATAFLKLATKINDKFVKPLIRRFNDNIVPVIGKAVGTILGLVGNLLKGLAGIIDWIADCTPLVIALASAFTGVFLAIKIAKFIELANAIEGSHKFLRLFVESLTKTSVFQNAIKMVSNLKTTYDRLNTVLKNTGVWSTLKEFIDKGVGSMKNFAERMSNSDSVLGRLAGSVVNKLGSALSWLASNPLFAVAGAIALVVGGLAVFASSQQDTTRDITDCSEAVQEQYQKFVDLSDAVEKAGDNIDRQVEATQVQTELASDYIDMLKEMSDEDGYVDNVDKANYLIGEINKILPDTVQLTEDGRLAWQKTPEEIQKTIESTIKLAKAQAYQEAYVESTKDTIEQQRLLRGEQEKLAVLYDNARVSYDNYIKSYDAGNHKVGEQKITWEQWIETLENSNSELADQKVLVDEATKGYEKSTEKNKYYKDGLDGLVDSYGEVSESTVKLTEKVSELSDGFESSKNKILEEVIKGNQNITLEDQKLYTTLLEYLDKHGVDITKIQADQYKEMVESQKTCNQNMTTEQQGQYMLMLSLLSQNGIEIKSEKSNQYYEMLSSLQISGKVLSEEQRQQYVILLGLLSEHGVNITKENASQYSTMLQNAVAYGIDIYGEEGKTYAKLIGQLSQCGVDMSDTRNQQHIAQLIKEGYFGKEEGKEFLTKLKQGVESGNIDPELQQILTDAGIVLENNPQTVPVDVENPKSKAQTIFDEISGIFSSPLKVMLGVGMDTSQLGAKMGNAIRDALNIPRMATGGFPDVGQLFIANEAGPELIGNLGGRTAVANHYQIEEGIANAVARGSMGNNSSAPQVINTHITVDLDSEVVAEAVHKSESKKGFNFTKGGGKL